MVVNNAESYIACCRAGLGLMQIPRYDVQHLLDAGELVEVLPGYRAASMPIALIYPIAASDRAAWRCFMSGLKACCSRIWSADCTFSAILCLITLIIQAVRPSASA